MWNEVNISSVCVTTCRKDDCSSLTNVGRVPTGRSAAMGCCVGFTTGPALYEGAVPVRQIESIPEPRG